MEQEDVALYKRNARLCLKWARKATDEEHREAFINLARTWLSAATRLRGATIHKNPRFQPPVGQTPGIWPTLDM
jgi:hypothetical protein